MILHLVTITWGLTFRNNPKEIPRVTSKSELRKILGVFNTCRGVLPKLHEMALPLERAFKENAMPEVKELQERVKRI